MGGHAGAIGGGSGGPSFGLPDGDRPDDGLTHVDRVGTLKGIVYIEDVHHINPNTRPTCGLSHRISVVGTYRMHLIVALDLGGDWPLTITAHQLQHAIKALKRLTWPGQLTSGRNRQVPRVVCRHA